MGSLYGGLAANKESKIQAQQLREETEIQARNIAEEDRDLRGLMKVSFLKSGVTLEGTPLMVLADAKKKSEQDVADLRRSGSARADSIRRRGKDALVGGILSSAETGARLAAGGM